MKILVIGSGGREHALVSTLKRSPREPEIYCAPGNGGMAGEARLVDINPDAGGIARLAAFARKEGMDMTVVGPEAPLVLGIADTFEAEGLRVFGPNRKAAQLEGSKCFAKEFMARHGIPTADFEIFDGAAAAKAYVERAPLPIVIKADGLAAGKGVIVAADRATALGAVESILVEERFGEAGKRVVIETCLTGSEVSLLVLTDGESYVPLETAQDYKRVFDGDRGPNTGGMGCYSPCRSLQDPAMQAALADVVAPTLSGLHRDGIRYSGVLYIGLMLTAAGPRVLEFNCRFGDPETQGILLRLKGDLVEAFEKCIDGDLGSYAPEWDSRPAVCVVAASPGYPDAYPMGLPIEGLDAVDGPAVKVFHAGTRRGEDGRFYTAGGRVLSVTALGSARASARARAYAALARIRFEGMHYRRDIGLGTG